MKIYQKMKAAVVDLSEVLDEAVSFNAYAFNANGGRRFAYAYAADSFGIGTTTAPDAAKIADQDGRSAGSYGDVNRYTRVTVS